jgi:hypothetical protein
MAGRATLSVCDTLLFIGATAVALAIFRSIAPLGIVERTILVGTQDRSYGQSLGAAHPSDGPIERITGSDHSLSRGIRAVIYGVSPFLACWSLANGWSGRRRTGVRPGTLVAPLILLSAIPVLLRYPTFFWAPGILTSVIPWGTVPHWWWLAWIDWPREAGLAVSAGWISCALLGRWEASDRRLEHLARALGAAWIAAAIALVVADWLYAFGH